MTKTLYLMRHGQTLFNFKGIIQGAGDSPLTELGISQAKKAKQYFDNLGITFDSFYSSTQERASDTLENVVPGTEYIRLKGLKEWHFGMFEGETVHLFDNMVQPDDLFGDRMVPFGGESKEQVATRLVATMKDIMTNTSENALVVSHGTAIALFLRQYLNIEQAVKYNIGNCNILKFEYDDTNNNFEFIELIDPVI
ncbi:histidine phosphatase family protein [Staphylococcus simiae]|uniref:histidine phosphatase family protein n=1 Tax=Staphylococcus simiae TaxID=308354 RepID=UPI001A976A41|nr:histidine phosphatase family protein [Staphylococcus simiae]MBO1199884.1 histidine phosphatase family protein [Staphylococcus simiae]MBO1202171.1 histidine phosphatase family protein [Staphylococcus simiae]MBO1204429.1 histidine phosphatase family protein [Staphylococcus simiae]MBO1211969.1 histidine phosphatase family protein [Staphylococcus simiae]MBO1230614.1 histidine phosphatase family protein [Staphylococcus simiae]